MELCAIFFLYFHFVRNLSEKIENALRRCKIKLFSR